MAFPSFLKIFHFQDILWSCFLTSCLGPLFTPSLCTWTGILKMSLFVKCYGCICCKSEHRHPSGINHVCQLLLFFLWVVNYWEITVGNKCVSVNSPLKVKVISLFITQYFLLSFPYSSDVDVWTFTYFTWMLLEALKGSFWQLYCSLNNLSILISYRMWLIHVLKHIFLHNFRKVIAIQS